MAKADFTDEDNEIIERIYQAEEDQEEDERIAGIQARVNAELKERFGMTSQEFYELSDEETNRLLAEEKASEQRIEKSQVDVEQAPLSPAELSDEAKVKYSKLVEFGSDPQKALDWIDKHSTGTFDDHALKAVSNRLLSDDKLRETAEYAEGKRLLQAYWSELNSQGLSTKNIEDYFNLEMTRHHAKEAIARDRGIQRQLQKEKDAEVKALKLNNRAKAAKWANESRQLGIPPDASVIAAKLGCAEKDIRDLCE